MKLRIVCVRERNRKRDERRGKHRERMIEKNRRAKLSESDEKGDRVIERDA